MASGQHEGKIVLVAPDEAGAPRLHVADRRPFLDPEATYLITGGSAASASTWSATCLRPAPVTSRCRPGPGRAAGRPLAAPRERHRVLLPWRGRTIDIVPGDVCGLDDVDRVVRGLTRPLRACSTSRPSSTTASSPTSPRNPWRPCSRPRRAERGTCTWRRRRGAGPLRPAVVARLRHGQRRASVYAAANAFLDGLAAYRRAAACPRSPSTWPRSRRPAWRRASRTCCDHAGRRDAAGEPAVAIASLDAALRGAGGRRRRSPSLRGHRPASRRRHHPDFMRTGRWMRGGPSGRGHGEG